MNNFAVITKAEQDVAKAKAHLSVLKQKINDSKAKLEDAKKDYDDNINTVSSDNSGIHEYILSVDLIKVELNKAEASLLSLNDEINNAKEASKKASEVHSAAKQKTIEMGDRFYNIKKKADTFKDSISKVEENLNAKKAVYDEYIDAADKSQDKIDEAKALLKELEDKYNKAVASIQDLQEEYNRNSSLISGRKTMLEKAEAEEADKKKDYEQIHSIETIKKVAYDRTIEAQNRLKPAYDEAVNAEKYAKEEYEDAAKLLEEAHTAYDNAVNDEAAKEKKYNSQVDIGRDSHNNDYDAVLDNLRAEEKSISLITDFTINNPDIQDYCKHLILYNLTVHDYKDISFGEWIVNLKGLSGLAYIPVSFTKNGISDKTNYSCECKKNSDNRIDICECDISDMSHIIKKPFFTEKDFLNGTDLYQLSLKSIQDDINNAEIAYNKAKTTTDNAAATLETRKAVVPGLKTEYEKAVKNAESIKMNFNTQRAMVNRSKTEYDETAKAVAAAYEIYEQV